MKLITDPTVIQLYWSATATRWAANDLRRARNFWRGLCFAFAIALAAALTWASR